jgi:hypothetical protein
MKKGFLIAATTLSALFALPAVAGPNWQVIHDAEHQASVRTGTEQEVLPLDHGPRALSTPWVNKEERLSIAAREQKTDATHKLATHKSAEQLSSSHG